MALSELKSVVKESEGSFIRCDEIGLYRASYDYFGPLEASLNNRNFEISIFLKLRFDGHPLLEAIFDNRNYEYSKIEIEYSKFRFFSQTPFRFRCDTLGSGQVLHAKFSILQNLVRVDILQNFAKSTPFFGSHFCMIPK